MARIGFEIPDTMNEMVTLINHSKRWNLTLIDTKGHVFGHYQTDYGHFRDTLNGAALRPPAPRS